MGTNLWIGYEGTGEGSGKRGVQWTPATRRVSTCSVNIVEVVSVESGFVVFWFFVFVVFYVMSNKTILKDIQNLFFLLLH